MTASPYRRALGIAVVVLAIALPEVTLACSGRKLIEGSEAAYAERVEFTGTVVRRDDPNGGPIISTGDRIRWTFIVDSVTRGDVGERFTVTSARSSSSCGEELDLGRRYSITAWGGEDPKQPDVGPGDARALGPLDVMPPVEGSFTDRSLVALLFAPVLHPEVGVMLIVLLIVARWMLRSRERRL
jgi:hypothetical protein